MKNNLRRGFAGFLTLSMLLSLVTTGAFAAGSSVTITGDTTVETGSSVTLTAETEKIGSDMNSWSSGGTDASTLAGDDYAYDPALYVTADGVQEQLSATDRITDGSYNNNGAYNVVIDDSESGHNGIIVNDTAYAIKNATITMKTDADGTDTCDFSGKGTAIAAYGENAIVTIENSTIDVAGVANMAVFSDSGATVTIKGSTLVSEGGTIYESYMNSPDQTTMVAPPWILGIMGNSRCTNLEGNNSTMNVIDSDTYASNWAVLSTDSGSNMYLNMYNTTLTLTNKDESSKAMQAGGEFGETLDNPYTENYGAGYGTYDIGSAVETFAGATLNVGTYAEIFTGGTSTYTSIEEGQTYTLKNALNEANDVTYTAAATKVTTVNSDTFGFMFHQGTNALTLEKGTVVNSGYATFLMKTGSSNETATVNVDDTTINNGGVLIQVIDNDDATNGGMLSADDELNTNGGSMNFIPYHSENAGFATEAKAAGSDEQNFTFTNGTYTGNIYNASGTDVSPNNSGLNATILNVVIGSGAEYSGAVASTAAVHVTYEGSVALKAQGGYALEGDAADEFAAEYQNTYYAINHYFDQGQVANKILENGAPINMTIADGGVWYVTGTSVISSLTMIDGVVTVPAGVTLTVGDKEYTYCTITADGVYEGVYSNTLSSFGSGGDDDYAFNPSLYIDANGENTALENGNYTGKVTATEADDVVIESTQSGVNGIIVNNAVYTIKNAKITLNTAADGSDTCDFSGKGTAIAVYGAKSDVTIEKSTIEVSGVAAMAGFSDNGATTTFIKSTLTSKGGTIYKEYMNSPDQAAMVAPPWILGIMGTSRCTNLEGNDSTMNFIDTDTYSSNWAVLSTDSGSNMYLNMYNTTLTLTNVDEDSPLMQAADGEMGETKNDPYTTNYGAGYGTYAIGAAVETFAGTTLNVGTYAIIFTGGTATFKSITEGEVYTLASATGNTDKTYTATATKDAVVNSDTFGFMFHQGTNALNLEQGTKITSGYATFLMKTGSSSETATVKVNGATIDNGGVLIQVMDNDDATNGGMMSADDPLNTNGSGMNFIPYHTENAGFATEAKAADSTTQDFYFANGTYTGNIYNASGTDVSPNNSGLAATTLNVTFGEGATYEGAVASTAAVHVTYEGSVELMKQGGFALEGTAADEFAVTYQNLKYTMNQYYDQGQVANKILENGAPINITLVNGATWTVTGTSIVSSLTLGTNAQVVVESGTLTVGDTTYPTGTVLTYNYVDDGSDNLYYADPKSEDGINSWTSGGTTVADNDYLFNAAAVVTADGVDADKSNTDRIALDNEESSFDGTAANGITITDSASGHNGIIVVNTEYTISNATITLETTADGSNTCDFSGKGTAVAVYGDDANVTIENSTIAVAGVANMAIFSDNGATVTVKNSTLSSMGGTMYQAYMNSPDQATMVAPPWILGIMGTSRCTNLEGTNSTMNVMDSNTSSANWAVLSTDSGSNMYLNMYGSSLTLTNKDESSKLMQAEGGEFGETLDDPYTTNYGAGYGTYAIGKAVETFAGTEVNVGTYAVIFTGGTATFTSITKGEVYTLQNAADDTKNVEYTASATKAAVVHSDTFGFMFHQGTNALTLEKGTVINSGYATFLMKTGSSSETATVTVDDTTIKNGGVLIQVMDNDDATNGGMLSADDPLNTNGGSMNFTPYHTENAGFKTEAAAVDTTKQDFTFTNGSYSGNIYNASGTDNSQYGPLNASVLNVTFGEGAVYEGAIASTAAIHVTYEGSQIVKDNNGYAYDSVEAAAAVLAEQNTYYSINHYFDQGQVANLVLTENGAPINVTVKDGATWTVTGTSVISSLTIENGGKVVINEGATLIVAGQTVTAVTESIGEVAQPASASGSGSGSGHGGHGGGGSTGTATESNPYVETSTVTYGTVAEPAAAAEGGQGGGMGMGMGMGGGDAVVFHAGDAIPESATTYGTIVEPAAAGEAGGGMGGGMGGDPGMGGDAGMGGDQPAGDDTGDKPVTSAYTWTASNENVTITDNCDGTATVTGVTAGTVEITVTCAAGTATMTLTVVDEFKYADDTGADTWAWASSYIYSVREKGIMVGEQNDNGYFVFNADTNLTRAEAAVIMLAVKGVAVDKTAENTFSDVADDAWYAPYVATAAANGLTSGNGDGTFAPEANITRAEFVTMLLAAKGIAVDNNAELPFADVAADAWYAPYVATAAAAGMTSGDDQGNFNPENAIIRAEAATMVDAVS